MKAWLKLLVKLRNDGRWIRLADLDSKVWVQCLLCARMAEDACSIPGPDDLALELHRPETDVAAAYERLAGIGWLCQDETGWTVPKFAEVQGDEKDRELARIRKARQREKSRSVTVCHDESRSVTVCHDESRVTDGVSRPVTVCHALEERRGEETREDISTANAVSPPEPGDGDEEKPLKGGLVAPEKRDPLLAEFWDVYRFVWAKRARPETFWGRNPIAEKHRKAARAILAAYGMQTMAGLIGESLNPYWKTSSFGMTNACRAHNIEHGIGLWKKQPQSWRDSAEAKFDEWRKANG